MCVFKCAHRIFFFILSTWCEVDSGEKRLQYNKGFRAREHICHVIFVRQREKESHIAAAFKNLVNRLETIGVWFFGELSVSTLNICKAGGSLMCSAIYIISHRLS